MDIQINYNKETKEIIGWSEDTENMNEGSVLVSKVVKVTKKEFDKLKEHKYLKSFDKKLIFKDNEKVVKLDRQKELTKKLKDKDITDNERDELLLNLLGK